jgi:hypothetical protein
MPLAAATGLPKTKTTAQTKATKPCLKYVPKLTLCVCSSTSEDIGAIAAVDCEKARRKQDALLKTPKWIANCGTCNPRRCRLPSLEDNGIQSIDFYPARRSGGLRCRHRLIELAMSAREGRTDIAFRPSTSACDPQRAPAGRRVNRGFDSASLSCSYIQAVASSHSDDRPRGPVLIEANYDDQDHSARRLGRAG